MTHDDKTQPRVYQTKDSGSRQQFDSGLQREGKIGKPRFDLIIPQDVPYDEQLLTRIAALVERGARGHSDRNWEQARSQVEIDSFKASAFRHFVQWFTGETDEDHAAAVVFNVLAVETTNYKMRQDHRETDAERDTEGESR